MKMPDPAIKLFGKTIQLPPNYEPSALIAETANSFIAFGDGADHDQQQQPKQRPCSSSIVGDGEEDDKKCSDSGLTETKEEDGTSHLTAEDSKDPGISCENPEIPFVEKEPSTVGGSKNDEQSETSISQEKTLKKPDKIIPCPRCNSLDTKFCYFNNYNVNQPRHFCKNCQRYWTAGGTMRSVPVGSGRRKNKSSPAASHYRHIMVSEALQAVQAHAANNGTVLTFGSDTPLREKPQSCVGNGIYGPEKHEKSASHGGRDKGYASDLAEKGSNSGLQELGKQSFPLLPPQAPCFAGPPFPSPWNSPHWRSTMALPSIDPSGFPIAFYAAPPYWGCALPGPWTVPWLAPPEPAVCPSPNSQVLGKHSRDEEMLNPSKSEKEEPAVENNSERCIWIPKTLRIDDPSEAAKSSVWSTFGIKGNKVDSINGGGLFKDLQSKGNERIHREGTSLVLQANPAALSRSFNFHESV